MEEKLVTHCQTHSVLTTILWGILPCWPLQLRTCSCERLSGPLRVVADRWSVWDTVTDRSHSIFQSPSNPWVRSQVSCDCKFFSLPKPTSPKNLFLTPPPLFSLSRREVWAPCRDWVHPKRRRARVWQWHRGRRGSKDFPKAKNHPNPAPRPATLHVQLSSPLRLADMSPLYHAFFSRLFVGEKKMPLNHWVFGCLRFLPCNQASQTKGLGKVICFLIISCHQV